MPKRKIPANMSPPASVPAIPPALPPSVEEAYRRKCMELKQRSKEVDDVNDATKLRISRLNRQVDKLRVERAFLLEQLVKRTSTNVDDSDGSSSPPPTPKEKPLRLKRGHKKPSILSNLDANPVAASTFINQNLATLSPGSDAFPTHAEQKDGYHKDLPVSRSNPASSAAAAAATATAHNTNGGSSAASLLVPPTVPRSAIELYADSVLTQVQAENQSANDENPSTLDQELSKRWDKLADDEKEPFHERERAEQEKYQKRKEEFDTAQKARKTKPAKNSSGSADGGTHSRDKEISKDVKTDSSTDKGDAATAASAKRSSQDEDVKMENYDSDRFDNYD